MKKHKTFGNLDFSNIRGDIFGGVTAGIVALPLALAFGLQSGLGAAAGLYGAIFISFFGAFFGGTKTQISGPTAPMTAVSMLVVAGIVSGFNGDLEAAIPTILTVFLLAGVVQIAFGFLGIGRYIRFIPYPVVSGFMTGIGVIILITQILPMLGYYPKEDEQYVQSFVPQSEEILLDRILQEEAAEDILVLEDFKETIRRAGEITDEAIMKEAAQLASRNASGVIGSLSVVGRALGKINMVDVFLGLITILIIYGFKRITTAIPSTLVALLAVTLGAVLFLPSYRTIGEIPSGFPLLNWDIFSSIEFAQLQPYLLASLSLAALGAIDSLLTSVVADNMTKTVHNSNKELVGQGIGNSIAAIFGGIPGAGATIRTVVNIKSGGKTPLSGMCAGIFLLIILLSLGPLASRIPAAVLAGVLITVGIGVMDYKGLKHIFKLPKGEVVIMLIVLLLTVFWGLVEAVIIGLVLAALFFMTTISNMTGSRTKASSITDFVPEIPWSDEKEIFEKLGEKIYIKHLDGPFFFGFTFKFREMITEISKSVKVVIIRMDKVPYMDQSGLYAMEDAIKDLHAQGKRVVFTDVHGQPRNFLRKFNVIPGEIEEKYCFDNFAQCAAWVKDNV